MSTSRSLHRVEAVDALLQAAPKTSSEPVSIHDALGRVTVEPVRTDRDHPPFNRSTMDGFAVRNSDIVPGVSLPVYADVPAGSPPPSQVPKGHCVKIATGAAVPDALNAVVQHELCSTEEPIAFNVEYISSGHNIHHQGADLKKGEILIEAGVLLGPAEIGSAASGGHDVFPVAKRPRIAVVSTGDELVDLDQQPGPWQLRDSNSPMIAAAVQSLGGELIECARARDTPDDTISVLDRLRTSADMVITLGGVSVGHKDHIPGAWDALNARPLMERPLIQPGRPTRAWTNEYGVAVGLPGNPVSALVCMHLFVRAWIRAVLGLEPLGDWSTARICEETRPNPKRTLYRACRKELDHEGHQHARVHLWHGSGDLPHLVQSDGIVELPLREEMVSDDCVLPFLPWRY